MEATSAPLTPKVLWAQRKDVVYVTVEIVEAADERVTIGELTLSLSARSGTAHYALDVELFAAVDAAASTQTKTARHLFFTLKKADADAPYWPRLLKTGKPAYVSTDFNRWRDEDDVSEPEAMGGFGGMGDMGGMGGFGGMGGMGGFGGMGGMGGLGGMNFSQFGGEDDEPLDEEAENSAEGESDEDPYAKPAASAEDDE